MNSPSSLFRIWLPSFLLIGALSIAGRSAESNWIDLSGGKELSAWKAPTGAWQIAGSAELDPANPKLLVSKPGVGVLVNGPKGMAPDILTKESFGDVEVHLEFMVPKGSNSGIKFEGHYEIQIFDSWGVKEPKGDDCGGIYPRAELKPKYHHIDKGIAPLTNACRPPGEWQTLDIIFTAPRFDANGKKTANARFVKVTLNDKLIHDNVELLYPTGHAWVNKEVPQGPILLQGDHGPVAFRNLRVRPYFPEKK